MSIFKKNPEKRLKELSCMIESRDYNRFMELSSITKLAPHELLTRMIRQAYLEDTRLNYKKLTKDDDEKDTLDNYLIDYIDDLESKTLLKLTDDEMKTIAYFASEHKRRCDEDRIAITFTKNTRNDEVDEITVHCNYCRASRSVRPISLYVDNITGHSFSGLSSANRSMINSLYNWDE